MILEDWLVLDSQMENTTMLISLCPTSTASSTISSRFVAQHHLSALTLVADTVSPPHLQWKFPKATGFFFLSTISLILAFRFVNVLRYVFKASYVLFASRRPFAFSSLSSPGF